ncbi:hypothetical protein IAI18_05895 [Acetobacteraceae bacterium H6797]|nr:hypothetical protein [Acetobacteraceae bacterium H6797]
MRAPLLAALLTLTAPGLALAQGEAIGRDGYRRDVPQVLSPPRPPAPPPETPFETAYRRAGRPRVILFFNRDITDRTRAGIVLSEREQLTARGSLDAQVTPGSPPASPPALTKNVDVPPADPKLTEGRLQAQEERQAERSREVTVRREASGSRASVMDEASQWLFESAFTNRLVAEKVKLVDRSVAIRLAGTMRTDDPQQLEMAALRQHADLVLLVRAAPLPDDNQLIFRVTAVDTRNGQLVTDDILLPQVTGGARNAAAGEAAATQLVQRLIAVWNPRPR